MTHCSLEHYRTSFLVFLSEAKIPCARQGGGDSVSQQEKCKQLVLSLSPVDFIKLYVSPAPGLPPGEGQPSEEAGTPLPRQESAEEEEEEESGALKDSQKVLEKSQETEQLEGNDMTRLELGGGEEWIVESLALRF